MKKQAEIRVSGYLPPLDEFIRHRRFTGGVIPAVAMIELGLGIELPEEVLSHPLMCIMLDCANDFVCLSNVRFFFEQLVRSYLILIGCILLREREQNL